MTCRIGIQALCEIRGPHKPDRRFGRTCDPWLTPGWPPVAAVMQQAATVYVHSIIDNCSQSRLSAYVITSGASDALNESLRLVDISDDIAAEPRRGRRLAEVTATPVQPIVKYCRRSFSAGGGASHQAAAAVLYRMDSSLTPFSFSLCLGSIASALLNSTTSPPPA